MISAVILTKNEENNIEAVYETVSFCDEIVVVDDNSTDTTINKLQILNKYNNVRKPELNIFSRNMKMDYSAQSNYGMEKTKGEWILFIDADERISNTLRQEIIDNIQNINNKYKGFIFKREDIMWGRLLKHGESGAFKSLRLVRKNSGKWMRRVHPYFVINGSVGFFENPLLHIPHKTLSKFVDSVNRWSSRHAIANKEEGKKSTLFKVVFYPIGHFINNYFFRLGFLDGMQGFVMALIMSFHSYLSWSKQWMFQKGFKTI